MWQGRHATWVFFSLPQKLRWGLRMILLCMQTSGDSEWLLFPHIWPSMGECTIPPPPCISYEAWPWMWQELVTSQCSAIGLIIGIFTQSQAVMSQQALSHDYNSQHSKPSKNKENLRLGFCPNRLTRPPPPPPHRKLGQNPIVLVLFARLWYVLIKKTCWDRIPTLCVFLWLPLVDHQAARWLPDVCLLYLLLSLALPATTESHLVQNWGKQHHVGAYPGTYKSLLLSDDFLMEKIPFVFIDEKSTSYPIVNSLAVPIYWQIWWLLLSPNS